MSFKHKKQLFKINISKKLVSCIIIEYIKKKFVGIRSEGVNATKKQRK